MNRHVLYLDSRIHGAAIQLTQLFRRGVFDRRDTTVLIKEHRDSIGFYRRHFNAHSIDTRTVKTLARMPSIDGCIVFYAFNAQSNIRLIGDRSAKHVFITHGESNKRSSCKPIARIYDYLVAAGNAGIDRYIEAGVFSRHEATSGRIVALGDTFIRGDFVPASNIGPTTDACVLYAPTWEGGNTTENYSSVNAPMGFRATADIARQMGVRTIVVQPHPNLGHRCAEYRWIFARAIATLKREGFTPVVVISDAAQKLRWILRLLCPSVLLASAGIDMPVKHAVVDVSAMEVQLLASGIPVSVMLRPHVLDDIRSERLHAHYARVGIPMETPHEIQTPVAMHPIGAFADIRDYYVGYSNESLADMRPSQRLNWLTQYMETGTYWN